MKSKDFGSRVEFYPYEGDTFFHVTCYKPSNEFGTAIAAEVNWGCHGSDTPERATLFAKAIIKASKLADKLNKEGVK